MPGTFELAFRQRLVLEPMEALRTEDIMISATPLRDWAPAIRTVWMTLFMINLWKEERRHTEILIPSGILGDVIRFLTKTFSFSFFGLAFSKRRTIFSSLSSLRSRGVAQPGWSATFGT